MNLPTTATPQILALLLLSALCFSPMVLAQSPAEGWTQEAEGFYSREGDRTTEYLARSSAGMAKITPLVAARQARAKDLHLASPTEESFQLVSALASLLDQVRELSGSGAEATAACTQGADYGGTGFTQALACGNQASANAYAINNGNCTGPFSLYAFSQASRDCGQRTQTNYVRDDLVAGWGLAASTIQLTGGYSACSSYASAWAISKADNVIYVNEDTGSGTGCSSMPRSCPLCAVIHDDPT